MWTPGMEKTLDGVMRQEHRAGEKLFVDLAGVTLPIIDRATGEVTALQIFVATLGASNYTYAEGCVSQNIHSWLQAHIHVWEFFEGVTDATVPDNLKAGVKKTNFYEPDINAAYQLSHYYDTASCR